MAELAVYDNDPTLYLFTSLTAGSSHIVTATSRIETILKANKIPFKGVDTATDDLARKLFGRRASGKKLPLLVKGGYVLGDLEMIEEWNEYGELKEALGFSAVATAAKPKPPSAAAPAKATTPTTQKENTPAASSEQNLAIRQLGAEAAKVAASKKTTPAKISTTNPLLSEKVNSPASAAATPKSANAGGILSPRSTPLPSTPSHAAADAEEERSIADEVGLPKIDNKPVKKILPMHDDGDADLDRGPKSVTQRLPLSPSAKSPTSPASEERKSFHGSNIENASQEEIKKIEKEQAIAEASSSEEEDSEDEDDDEDDSDEDDSEEGSEDEEKPKVVEKAAAKEGDKKTTEKGPEKTAGAKATEKAGESVGD